MPFDFGDVVLVPFPFTNQTTSKKRPAVVRQAGLLKPSAIKPVFATLEEGLVIRKLGALGVRDREALKLAMAQVLG